MKTLLSFYKLFYFSFKSSGTAFKFLTAILMYTTIHQTCVAQSWSYVGNPGSVGISRSGAPIGFAIAPDDAPYVSYRRESDGAASVKKFNGTSWINVGTDGFSSASTYYNSIAIDKNGTTYVAFADASDVNKLTVMKFNGTNWVNVGAPVFSTGQAWYPLLAVNNAGVPYVAFNNYINSYVYTVMKFDGTNWVNVGTPGFATPFDIYVSFAIDNNDIPYLAYAEGNSSSTLTVMKFNGTNWVNVGAAGSISTLYEGPSLSFDNNGTPYVAFASGGFSTHKSTVLKFNGSSWVPVGTVGFSPGNADLNAIAISKTGTPYVSFIDGANSLKASVMKFDGSSWILAGPAGISPVLAIPPFVYLNIAIDKNGTPAINFMDVNTYEISVMKSSAILPVSLMEFKGNTNNDAVLLNWNTASEQNNDHFEVQRSDDGINFTTIGNVKGHGNSSSINNYVFTDNQPIAGSINYYRLKQLDYDGHFTLSKTISLKGPSATIIRVSPNPANGLFHLLLDKKPSTLLQLTVYDAKGSVVTTKQITETKTSIDLTGKAKGMYRLYLQYRNGSQKTINVELQ